jgi:hypothetical protein
MWNTSLVYLLFPNTVLIVQGDHVELARVFQGGAPTGPSWTSGFTCPRRRPPRRAHPLGQEHAARLDVVMGEVSPTGRSIQIGLTSGAQTHLIYSRNGRR